ncbi:hypothetical protein [Clostridium cavendishii]|nr:hypothetical protein [Clostridium cavendishii]
METKVEENKITFKTPHFSKYVVYVIVEKQNGESKLLVTGSNVNTNRLLILASLMGVAGVFIRKR